MTTAIHRTKWFLPGFSVLIGLVFFAGFWIGDDRAGALWSLAVMSVVALLILAGGRFDLVRGLRGDGRDEYWARIDLHATALAGSFAIGLILVMCVLRFYEFRALKVRWDTSAYGSAAWAVVFSHTALLVLEAAETLTITALIFGDLCECSACED